MLLKNNEQLNLRFGKVQQANKYHAFVQSSQRGSAKGENLPIFSYPFSVKLRKVEDYRYHQTGRWGKNLPSALEENS